MSHHPKKKGGLGRFRREEERRGEERRGEERREERRSEGN